MITRVTVVALAIWLWALIPVSGTEYPAIPVTSTNPFLYTNPPRTVFEEFSRQEELELTIETDLVNLIDNRRTEDFQDAVISYQNQLGEEVSMPLKLRPRGKYRRRVCDFPPVKLNFSKKELAARGLVGDYDKLKLVTHCLDDKLDSKENVLKEYLAYKIYNELSDYSYRVHLVKLTYVDSKGKLSKIKRYGILIEDTDEMATRLGGVECEDCLNPTEDMVVAGQENLMAFFQYLIGNADWNLPMTRNLKMVRLNDSGKLISVPYDFDFAGMVDPAYAVPNSDHGLTTLQERVYLGRPMKDDEVWKVINYLRAKRPAIDAVVENFQALSRTGRTELITYFNSFYELVDKIEGAKVKGICALLSTNSGALVIPQGSSANASNSLIGK